MGRIDLNVDAIGMNEVIARLDRVSELQRAGPRALNAGAKIVLNAARDLAPVRSGELKKSLKVGRRKKTADRTVVEVGTFYPNAPHAHLVEHGHGGPRPAPSHPFLQPAAEMSEDAVQQAVLEELKKYL